MMALATLTTVAVGELSAASSPSASSFPAPAPEPGGSACCCWNGYGTQCSHPAQGRTIKLVLLLRAASLEGQAAARLQLGHDLVPSQFAARRPSLERLHRCPSTLGVFPGTCPEPGGSACCYWNGYGTQCDHPAQGRTGGGGGGGGDGQIRLLARKHAPLKVR